MAQVSFGDKLRSLRVAAGYLSAREFAATLGLSENRYARYERGGAEPKFELLIKICEQLGVTPNDLLGFDDRLAVSSHQRAASGFSSPAQRALKTTTRVSRNRLHILQWRLAELFIDATVKSATSASNARGSPGKTPSQQRKVAEIFQSLQAESVTTTAQILSSPALAKAPRSIQLRIHKAADDLLSSVLRT